MGYTVKPLNNGQVGAKGLVHCSEVVLYWEVFIIKALYLYTMLSETGSTVRIRYFVSTFKISR